MPSNVDVEVPGIGIFRVPEDQKESVLNLVEALAANDPQVKILTQLLSTFVEHQKQLMARYTQDMKQVLDAIKDIQVQVPDIKVPPIKVPKAEAPVFKPDLSKLENAAKVLENAANALKEPGEPAQISIDSPLVDVPVAAVTEVTDVQRDDRTNRITGCTFRTVEWKDGSAKH